MIHRVSVVALLRNLKKKKVLLSVRLVRQQDVFGDTFLSETSARINGGLHPLPTSPKNEENRCKHPMGSKSL